MYPMDLAMKGIAGCGIFKVTVDENGKTDNVELSGNCHNYKVIL